MRVSTMSPSLIILAGPKKSPFNQIAGTGTFPIIETTGISELEPLGYSIFPRNTEQWDYNDNHERQTSLDLLQRRELAAPDGRRYIQVFHGFLYHNGD